MLLHVLQDCQTKIEQLDAEKDKLYFQLATEVSSKKAVSICIHCTVAVRHECKWQAGTPKLQWVKPA